MRFPDERSWHSVTKIYLILKISEGELEALTLSTEAPCCTPLSMRPAGKSPTAQLSQLSPKRLLLRVRHFIPDGCAWCHRLFNCTCCWDGPLNSLTPDPMPVWHLAHRVRGHCCYRARPHAPTHGSWPDSSCLDGTAARQSSATKYQSFASTLSLSLEKFSTLAEINLNLNDHNGCINTMVTSLQEYCYFYITKNKYVSLFSLEGQFYLLILYLKCVEKQFWVRL